MLEILAIKELFPVVGKNVTLRLFTKEDIAPKYVDWLNDPQIVQYSRQRFLKHTLSSCLEYFNLCEKNQAIFIAIVINDTKDIIGTMTVNINSYHNVADIAIMIGNKDYWGKGLAREAWNNTMDLLLDKAAVRKVTGGTLSCNSKMIAIFKNSGMQSDGIRVAQELIANSPVDLVHFAKFSLC